MKARDCAERPSPVQDSPIADETRQVSNKTTGCRILVTGGTGFVGGNLAKTLALNNRVRSLARSAQSPVWGDLVEGDLSDYPSLVNATKDIDVVYHVAGLRPKAGVGEADFWKTNVVGTENLIRAAAENGVKHFVYCSSTAGGDRVSEHLPYARSKKAAEEIVNNYASLELHTTVIRPTITYGPGDAWGMMTKMCIMIQAGKYVVVGNGENRFHVTYIDDVIQGFVKVMLNEKAFGKTYIIASREPIKHADLAEIIARELDVRSPKFMIPAFAAYPAAKVVETMYAVFGVRTEPVINTHKVDIAVKDQVYEIGKAVEELGYQPTVDYEVGVRKTVKWFRDVGILPRR